MKKIKRNKIHDHENEGMERWFLGVFVNVIQEYQRLSDLQMMQLLGERLLLDDGDERSDGYSETGDCAMNVTFAEDEVKVEFYRIYKATTWISVTHPFLEQCKMMGKNKVAEKRKEKSEYCDHCVVLPIDSFIPEVYCELGACQHHDDPHVICSEKSRYMMKVPGLFESLLLVKTVFYCKNRGGA